LPENAELSPGFDALLQHGDDDEGEPREEHAARHAAQWSDEPAARTKTENCSIVLFAERASMRFAS
jgi:hypothetical protein